MSITDEIKKLPRRVEKISGQSFSYVKLDDVLAVLSAQDGAVGVKALEWEPWPGDGSQVSEGQGQKREYVERALTPWGAAIFLVVKDGVYSLLGAGDLDCRHYAFASTAKADVQADYEARIRSALILDGGSK